MTEEEVKHVVKGFKNRVDYLKIKPNTKAFGIEQAAFFAGAMYALNKTSDGFLMCISSGRNILDLYKNYLN